jgi:hypothetical protein
MLKIKLINMKKMKLFSLAIIALLLGFSCKNDKNSNIIGTWKISGISSTSEIPKELKENYMESMNEMKSTFLLVIKPDSTFEHTLSGSMSKGKWNLSANEKTLTLTYDDGGKEISNVIELSKNKMVTSIEMNEAKNTITYEKQAKKN